MSNFDFINQKRQDARHQILDVGRQTFDVGRQMIDVGRQILKPNVKNRQIDIRRQYLKLQMRHTFDVWHQYLMSYINI